MKLCESLKPHNFLIFCPISLHRFLCFIFFYLLNSTFKWIKLALLLVYYRCVHKKKKKRFGPPSNNDIHKNEISQKTSRKAEFELHVQTWYLHSHEPETLTFVHWCWTTVLHVTSLWGLGVDGVNNDCIYPLNSGRGNFISHVPCYLSIDHLKEKKY